MPDNSSFSLFPTYKERGCVCVSIFDTRITNATLFRVHQASLLQYWHPGLLLSFSFSNHYCLVSLNIRGCACSRTDILDKVKGSIEYSNEMTYVYCTCLFVYLCKMQKAEAFCLCMFLFVDLIFLCSVLCSGQSRLIGWLWLIHYTFPL